MDVVYQNSNPTRGVRLSLIPYFEYVICRQTYRIQDTDTNIPSTGIKLKLWDNQ